jgi:hypothetical protein
MNCAATSANIIQCVTLATTPYCVFVSVNGRSICGVSLSLSLAARGRDVTAPVAPIVGAQLWHVNSELAICALLSDRASRSCGTES